MKLLSLCDFGQLQLLRQLEFFCAFCADFMRFRDTGVNLYRKNDGIRAGRFICSLFIKWVINGDVRGNRGIIYQAWHLLQASWFVTNGGYAFWNSGHYAIRTLPFWLAAGHVNISVHSGVHDSQIVRLALQSPTIWGRRLIIALWTWMFIASSALQRGEQGAVSVALLPRECRPGWTVAWSSRAGGHILRSPSRSLSFSSGSECLRSGDCEHGDGCKYTLQIISYGSLVLWYLPCDLEMTRIMTQGPITTMIGPP